MRPVSIFATLLSTAVVLATRQCGTHIDSAGIAQAEAGYREMPGAESIPPGSKRIQVHWNVVYSNKTLEGGYIPQNQIDRQMARLNHDYQKTPFTFQLANVTRVMNTTWFDHAHPNSTEGLEIASEMKSRLRKGGKATLNIYTLGFTELGGELLGYATFPWWLKDDPLSEDGVVLLYSTLPGGTNEPFNLGATATHEVGHWTGLYHTFEGEQCGGKGDYVSDTPFQSEATKGCPIGKDTCPGLKGKDPIHNFMDYSDDECLKWFSNGQIKRMATQMHQFRGI